VRYRSLGVLFCGARLKRTVVLQAMEILEKRETHLAKQMATALAEAKKKSKAKDKRGTRHPLTPPSAPCADLKVGVWFQVRCST
jgi:hypothetical protein